MNIGRLRHRVVIEAPVETQDASGDPVITWAHVATAWAAVEPIKGREATFGNQTLEERDTRIVVRWSPLIDTLSAKYRLRHRQDIYNIVNLAEVDMAHKSVEILCKSGVNDG